MPQQKQQREHIKKKTTGRAYQLVKELTTETDKTTHDKFGKCPTGEKRNSADGQTVAQNNKVMGFVMTMQIWAKFSKTHDVVC